SVNKVKKVFVWRQRVAADGRMSASPTGAGKTMTRFVLPMALLIATLGCAPQAGAQTLTRTFVSSAGDHRHQSNTAQPYATFARAYSQVLRNGIVAALDPGKYGPLTITGPVAINGNGWSAITAPAGGAGITINAGGGGTGNIQLKGLEIDGAGAGANGIVYNS